jgi:hypothetical protein
MPAICAANHRGHSCRWMRAAALVGSAVLAIGCAAPSGPTAGGAGNVYQQSQPITNFKSSGRAQVSRIAVVYPGAQSSQLLDDVVIKLADGFFRRSIGYTTARVDSQLSYINLDTYLRRFRPTHILRVAVPMQRLIEGRVWGFTLELHLVDTSDGMRVWQYQAEVSTGSSTTVESVVKSALAEMERDGPLPTRAQTVPLNAI